MSLSNTIVAALKRLATVPVYVGESTDDGHGLDSDQPLEAGRARGDLPGPVRVYAHTIWRNLPDPPDCERVYVIIWMISAEGYGINHFSVHGTNHFSAPWQ